MKPQYLAEAQAELARREPFFADIFQTYTDLAWSTDTDYFAALVRKIVAQQLSTAAARTVHGRVVTHLGGAITVAAVQSTTSEGLRCCGLSRTKVKYILGLAEHVADGRLDLAQLPHLDDETVVDKLTQVPGLGRWSAEMFLMFTLGRPDVFSMGDLALKHAMAQAYNKPVETFTQWGPKVADGWRPWRTVACRYLYAWLDGERVKLKAAHKADAPS